MMTPQLKQAISDIINNEAKLSLIEAECMARIQMMGWNGFKRLFFCRAEDRFKHMLYLKKCVVDYGNVNLPLQVEYMAPGGESSFSAIMQYVHDESMSHLSKMRSAMGVAFNEGETMIGEKLEYLIKDQSRECKKLKRILKGWENANRMNDTSWMDRTDKHLHEKYKRKTKKKYKKY